MMDINKRRVIVTDLNLLPAVTLIAIQEFAANVIDHSLQMI